MKEHTNNRFVAVLDIMGFKSIVENNPSTLVYDKMKKIYDEAMEVQKYFKLHVTIFSDSIFIITEDDTHESFEDIVIVTCRFMRFMKEGFAINGAISYGEVTCDRERNIVFGNPINEAHLCQEKLFCYSVVLLESAVQKKNSYNTLSNFCNKPDVVLDKMDIPVKNEKNTEYKNATIINWCEFYNTDKISSPYEEQIESIRRDLVKLYDNAKGKERAVNYIKNTEKLLKSWFDGTNSNKEWKWIDYK